MFRRGYGPQSSGAAATGSTTRWRNVKRPGVPQKATEKEPGTQGQLAMDVFALRNKVVSDYRRYIESFVRIRDSRIDSYVRQEFDSGVLWPDSILQLNPAYEPGLALDEL